MLLENMNSIKILVFVLIVWITTQPLIIAGGNILGLFPHIGYSHFEVYYPILKGLVENGHQLTVISYFKTKERHLNYTEYILDGKDTKHRFSLENYTPSRSLLAMWNEYWQLYLEGQESCETFYNSGYVETILKKHVENPFDLVIAEFFNTDCHIGVASAINVKVVGLSSCSLMPWIYDRIALPDNPSYVQSEFIGFTEPLNVFQRALNFIQSKGNKILYNIITVPADNAIIKNKLQISIDIQNFVKKSTSLILVNQHYSLMGNRPSTAQIIEIGGIHINKWKIQESLQNNISEFLQDVPQYGVLFISWGSNLVSSSIPSSRLEAIITVLQKFPIKVIWKWESDDLPTDSKKFLFLKWAPQLALLCHPNVTVFWGHGGLLGTTEAIYCGKPLILTPIYGDQFLNSHCVVNRGMGIILPYNSLNFLNTTLMKVFKNKYNVRAKKISKIFRNRPMSPLNLSIWWIEHLLNDGLIAHELLRTHAVDLNVIHLYSIDLVLYLIVIIFALLKLWKLRNREICNYTQNIIKFSFIFLFPVFLSIIYPELLTL